MELIDTTGNRPKLSQAGSAYAVSAAKSLLDALNTLDPFYMLIAYERIEPIALAVRKANEEEE